MENHTSEPFSGGNVVVNSVVLLYIVVEEDVLIHLLSPEMHVSQDSSMVGQDVKRIHSDPVASKVNHRHVTVELHN